MQDIIQDVLQKYPYFEKEREALDYALDKLTGKLSTVEGKQSSPGSILEGTLFFYGSESKYLEIEGSSKGIRDRAAEVSDYDKKRVIIPEYSVLYELEKNKNPLMILLEATDSEVRMAKVFEFKNPSRLPTELSIEFELNESIKEASEVLLKFLKEKNVSSIFVFASPLGVLKIGTGVPKEQFFETSKFGNLTGYAILFTLPDIDQQGLPSNGLLDELEGAMQVLWIIGNPMDRFKLFKYERKGRENFMADVIHRTRSRFSPLIEFVTNATFLIKNDRIPELKNTLAEVEQDIDTAEEYLEKLESFLGETSLSYIDLDSFCATILKSFQKAYPPPPIIKIKGKTNAKILALKSEIRFCIEQLLYNAYKRKNLIRKPIELLMTNKLNPVVLQKIEKNIHKADSEILRKSYVQISVKNYGLGIPVEFKETIFNPRIRLIKNENTGLLEIEEISNDPPRGMGLYLVKKYIEQHYGGLVFEDGDPGKFARFNMIFIKWEVVNE